MKLPEKRAGFIGKPAPPKARLFALQAARSGRFGRRHFIAVIVTAIVEFMVFAVVISCFQWFLDGTKITTGADDFSELLSASSALFLSLLLLNVVFLLPATALVEYFAGHYRWPRIWQLPLNLISIFLISSILVVTVTAANGQFRGSDFEWSALLMGSGSIALIAALPLPLYWWIAQNGPIVIAVKFNLLRCFGFKR